MSNFIISKMELNRQLEVFNPNKFQDKKIDVIGTGATGSYIVWLLTKIGLTNIRCWDDDKVESHNVPNQIFRQEIDLEKPKVEALAEMVKQGAGAEIEVRNELYKGQEKLGNIVFLLVDSMAERKKIWDSSIKIKLHVDFMIETRMDIDNGMIYALDPKHPTHIAEWEKTLYSDDEAATSACGTVLSIAPTASLIASLAVWELIKYFTKPETVSNEQLLGIRDEFQIVSRKFA